MIVEPDHQKRMNLELDTNWTRADCERIDAEVASCACADRERAPTAIGSQTVGLLSGMRAVRGAS